MFAIKNFTDNDDVRVLGSMGPFTVVEYLKDLSVTPSTAMTAYYCNEMNVRKRQVICDLSKANITLQAGAMQWMAGNVNATTGLKGVGDFFGKAVRGKVTGESAVKPEYTGNGVLVLEPTYRHILLIDLADWNGSIVLDDGLFLACDSKLKQKAVMRSNFSSAVAGGEGLFNLGVVGNGVLCLESPSPKEELIEVPLILPSSARARRCWARQLPGKVWSTSTAEPARCCWLRWAATANLCAATGGRVDEPCKPCPKAGSNQREILTAYLPPVKKRIQFIG